jgi:hypothetical protein
MKRSNSIVSLMLWFLIGWLIFKSGIIPIIIIASITLFVEYLLPLILTVFVTVIVVKILIFVIGFLI